MAFYTAQYAAQGKTFSTTLAATVTTITGGGVGVDEVQTITMNDGHAATGGTFTITFDGQTTSAIAYNASAATIKTALEALSNVAVDDISVSGTLSGGTITLTFDGTNFTETDVAEVTVSLASTTGTIYDKVTLSGCHAGILRVRNQATSGAALYFRAYPEASDNNDPPGSGDIDDSYVVPFSDLTDMAWNSPSAVVYIYTTAAQAYSVESISGLQ